MPPDAVIRTCRRAPVCAIGAVLLAASPAAAAPEPVDPKDMSAAFWSDWRKPENQAQVQVLVAAARGREAVASAIAAQPNTRQRVADMALTDPRAAAALMAAQPAAKTPEAARALATVVAMRTTAETRRAALAAAPAERRAEMARFTANLSQGIPGLPGIYLGDQPAQGHSAAGAGNANRGSAPGGAGSRPAMPQGLEPVAGGAIGCAGH